jgi:hypothetical protein
MANSTMAFETESLIGMICKSMSNDWPAGLAHKVVVQLFNKYSPDNRISRVELRTMLNGISMRDAEDPSILFEQVRAIRYRYNTVTHQINEEELIVATMGAAPEKYLLVSTSERQVRGSGMTLDDLEIMMYQPWHQSKGSIDERTTIEITVAGFEGYCYQCKQQGHKADACPN